MPSEARTGSPGTRWISAKAATTSTASETASRAVRRNKDRSQGLLPTLRTCAAATSLVASFTYARIRTLWTTIPAASIRWSTPLP